MAWPRSEGLTNRVIGPCERPRVRATIARPFSFSPFLIRVSCISKLLSRVRIRLRRHECSLSCDDKYEFGVGECFDRDHLLVLDNQSLAGMHPHSADLNFACCRYQIARVSFAEGIA